MKTLYGNFSLGKNHIYVDDIEPKESFVEIEEKFENEKMSSLICNKIRAETGFEIFDDPQKHRERLEALNKLLFKFIAELKNDPPQKMELVVI